MLKIFYLKISDFEEYTDDFFLPKIDRDTYHRALSLRHQKVRRTKLLSGAMVRQIIGTVIGLNEEDFEFIRGEHGKPGVLTPVLPVFYNLSHSGNYVVCAFSDREVGVDIEEKGRVRMNVADRFFHPRESAWLHTLSEREQKDQFFRIWSVKESYLKYTGTGLSGSLASFEVCQSSGEVWLQKEHSRLPVYIRECLIDTAYSCFVCSENSEPFTIENFTFQ